jgi:hypothetical protein
MPYRHLVKLASRQLWKAEYQKCSGDVHEAAPPTVSLVEHDRSPVVKRIAFKN